MLKGERVVGGLPCSEVLADLSRLLDGELPEADASLLSVHVSGCDVCERFGRRFAGVLRDLREGLREPESLSAGVAERLRARMASR
ncbi:MAG: zf-HC2 domain-containing protein [Holophagales bacterium]|nr:zf-HC2 domain-containing protein [Holophagales bacterium]MBK9967540.1 zf-HC2 domain-containing protein [Holophagales bacterium]